jgi:septal ring factor EnvC (AmiA/AmiB activator)
MANTGSTPEPTKVWTLAKDLLTLAIIPLLVWVIKIEVGNAQRDIQIQQLNQGASKVAELDARVQQSALQVARLDEKMDAIKNRLDGIHDEIRELVARSSSAPR